jgi:hypothetical protein
VTTWQAAILVAGIALIIGSESLETMGPSDGRWGMYALIGGVGLMVAGGITAAASI